MPPSKKKSMRVKPSHHLHNPQTDPKSVIEQLFLLRRFEEALELGYFILSDLCNREEDEDKVHKNKQPAPQVQDECADPQKKILLLKHNCKVSECYWGVRSIIVFMKNNIHSITCCEHDAMFAHMTVYPFTTGDFLLMYFTG
jgi:hypothetical protein